MVTTMLLLMVWMYKVTFISVPKTTLSWCHANFLFRDFWCLQTQLLHSQIKEQGYFSSLALGSEECSGLDLCVLSEKLSEQEKKWKLERFLNWDWSLIPVLAKVKDAEQLLNTRQMNEFDSILSIMHLLNNRWSEEKKKETGDSDNRSKSMLSPHYNCRPVL